MPAVVSLTSVSGPTGDQPAMRWRRSSGSSIGARRARTMAALARLDGNRWFMPFTVPVLRRPGTAGPLASQGPIEAVPAALAPRGRGLPMLIGSEVVTLKALLAVVAR